MDRAVVLVGGWAHPGHDQADAMRALLTPRGFDVEVVTDPDRVAGAITAGCDLLVAGACWFSMTDARYDDAQRAEFAVTPAPELVAALTSAREAGCPLLALHTAVICFDGADWWREWLGGTWNWETSGHPPPEPMQVVPSGDPTIEFSAFSVVDERYQGLDVDPGVEVVARSAQGDPLVWLNEAGGDRAAVSLLGHDRRSLGGPAHIDLHGRLLDWLLD